MKQKPFIGLFFLIFTTIVSCNSQDDNKSKTDIEFINKEAPFYTHQIPDGHPRISKLYDSAKIEDFWPFIIYKDSSYMVAANLNNDTTLNKFGTLFEKFEGDGTGYNWAALIKVILKKENPDLIKHLDFDPEAGAFYLFADSEKSQRQFAEFASEIFKDTTKIIFYLTGPDKEKALEFNPKD
jgi:Immunity protein 51